MQCSFKLLIPALILIAPVALAQTTPRKFPNVGTPLSQDEIKRFDFMIGPDGKELPAGHGTAKEGAAIFAQRCEVCHGKNGQNGITHHLVAGSPGKPYSGPFYGVEKDGPSYFPYPTIAWDYINRAMPAPNPGSLKPNEVYSLEKKPSWY
jgi:cytochrome c